MKQSVVATVGATVAPCLGKMPFPANRVRPNLLLIMTDQQRFDAIRFVQDSLADYDGKAKIETPNLDRLLKDGAYFSNAYSPCAVCAPARTVLRTGCTVERCGVQSNGLDEYETYHRMAQFRDKINSAESFEQILVEECGYQAAYFGKWHMPKRFNFKRAYTGKDDKRQTDKDNIYTAVDNPQDRVVRFNDVNWESGELCYSYRYNYRRELQAQERLGRVGITRDYASSRRSGFGPQYHNTYSGYPYDSVAVDARHVLGLPAGSPAEDWYLSQPSHVGRDCLDEQATPSFFTAEGARLAIRRFAGEEKPFIVTASFHNPHSPIIATGRYFDKVWSKRKDLLVPPSHEDPMRHSDYVNDNGRKHLLEQGLGYDNPAAIQEWMVPYYALCEEIDHHVGRLLEELETQGIADNTMVIFLSDHGEMLGAHGMREKNMFLEESARVPLFFKLPGQIRPGTEVDTPVSLRDVFATILDYCGASQHDKGDGASLRRYIDRTASNEAYDDETIVTEWDFRTPRPDGKSLARGFGDIPNFLVRKGPWKLMMTKRADSPLYDMLYNLEHDPYETRNLIYECEKEDWLSEEQMIGKAEHLKALLVDWMRRMDGDKRYYSDPMYNMGEGRGDIAEVRDRRRWGRTDFWVSDRRINAGPLARVGGRYRKKVWIYFGTTTPGDLCIESIALETAGEGVVLDGFTQGTISSGDFRKVAVNLLSVRDVLETHRLTIRYNKHSASAEVDVELSFTR